MGRLGVHAQVIVIGPPQAGVSDSRATDDKSAGLPKPNTREPRPPFGRALTHDIVGCAPAGP